MSEKIDPKEVLAYLNELGYTNITAQQLKEFIKDLQKVMKYDSRYGGAPETGMRVEPSYFEEESDYSQCSRSYEKENIVTSSINEKQTDNFRSPRNIKKREASSAKKIQRDKHIAVHIYDTKSRKYIDHEHCIHTNLIDKKSTHDTSDKSKASSHLGSASIGSKTEATESTIKCIPPCSSRELVSSRASKGSSRDKKSKVTFMRPKVVRPSFNKSDPVALYHYYQSEWKKTKIPGQDSRDDLRWAIRERMLSGPRVEVKSRCNIPRCGWTR